MTRVLTLRARKSGKASASLPDKASPPCRDQLPAAEDRLQRRHRELKLLNAVASAAYRHLELKTILSVALKQTVELMRVRGGIIWLYDQARHRLDPTAHRGISTALLRELHGLRLGESFSGAVAAYRKPLVISDASGDTRTIGSPAARGGLCAYVGVPILSRRKVLGVFALLDRRAGRFTKDDVALIGRLANQVGAAIENAQLYEEVRRELAARQQAEAALRESEERFRAVFERAAIGIALVTFRHRILGSNPALQEMLGYTADELRGKSFAAITHPDDLKASMRLFKAAIAGKQSRVHLEKRLFRKDGRTVWIALNCRLHRDAAGKPFFMISLFENITERKRAEEALRLSEAKYRRLHESISDAYASVDMNGRIQECNSAFEQLVGYTAKELRRLTYLDFTPKRWHAFESRTVRDQVLKRGYSDVYEKEYRSKDGRVFPVELRAYLIKDPSGSPSGMWAIVRDITRRKQAEEALRESEERFRTLFSKAPIGVATADARCRFLDANDAFCGMLGYSKEQLLRKTILDVTHPGDRPAFLKVKADVWAGRGSGYSAERRYVRKDGSFLFGRITAQTIRDTEGKFLYAIGMFEDITARKRAEERLKTYQERLRSLASQLALAEERERRRIATALHDEVGQSLALARLKVGELAGVSRREEFTALLQTVYEMIAQILQRTRSLTFELSPPVLYELGLGDAVGWLVEDFRKQNRIRWEFQGERLSPPLEDDVRVTLFQGARELLFNVVKHARAGTVKVRVECDHAEARIRIEDDGVGFAAEDLGSNPRGMTGFGLFSVRERLESLGGRLEIDSRIGGGTRAMLAAPVTSSDVPPRGN